ncbi:hypothetical protein NPX13_g9397 [Xylaria arbuscula]|uniref:WSC domain-containing protein n=1 Tax=Xylaria arbuscula TaxID=114810 RepID=A0A9W8THI3_9PEZI|nr:hypothetical protein NPX13_g9397 [Xylaria arbuscula]
MARFHHSVPFLAVMALMTGPALIQSLDIEYCASMNTADTPTNSSTWQSNGLCHDYCVDLSYAFAILQEHDCWCSNYVPAESSQVDSGECSDTCPGWTPDTCGADGLYGYIALDLSPSGTAEASSSTSTSTKQTTTTEEPPNTVTVTVDSPTSTTTSSSTTSSTTADSDTTTSQTSKTTKTADTTISTPTTSIKTVTAGGTISYQTVTVAPTTTPDGGNGAGSSADTSGTTKSSQGLSSGAAAGVAIGVLALVAIIAGVIVFFWLRRKRHRQEQLNSRPHSGLSGSQGVMSTPTTTMASIWDGENTSTGRRSSRLMPHDPRMDPFTTNIYARFENKSRESINTLQDNQDYSRKVLRTTNPDPPEQ